MLSQHFPPEVRDALARAAQTPVLYDGDLARVRAVDKAVAAARRKYPELFVVEPEPMRQVLQIADLFGGAQC